MKRVILIDGNSLMYRAFFGMSGGGNLMCNSKGVYTNAIYNFARMLNHVTNSEYDFILVAFDKGHHTFRHDIVESYKAGRAKMPDELRMQFPYVFNYLEICNIKHYEMDNYEADDIIGTLSLEGVNLGYHIDIYSSDKDMLQLVSPETTVHLTKKGMTELEDYTPEHVVERYGLTYNQMIDLKALMGDSSDNLKGIPGVGEVSAIKLLKEYGTLENIIASRDSIKGALGEKIRTNYESALLTKQMVTINRHSPLEINLFDTIRKEKDIPKLKEFYQFLEFNSFLKEMYVPKETNINSEVKYTICDNPSDLKEILLPNSSLIFETLDHNYHKSPLIVIGLKNVKGNFIIPITMLYESIDLQLFLSDTENKKSVFDYKRAKVSLMKLGFDLNGVIFDMLLATYILNPSIAKDEFKNIANFFNYDNISYDEEIYGTGNHRSLPEDMNLLYSHVIRKTIALFVLKNSIIGRLNEGDQMELLTKIEIPLSSVLANMEFEGISVDQEELKTQKEELTGRIENITKQIYELAGKEFNISSPKQLGVILFEELNLPCKKKTKTGYSTDNDVLESLRDSHEIVPLIIAYRALTKLFSTYLESLGDQIYPDGKIHTIYEQALTQTGRLSSIEPNLQNIPIRTEEGRQIRKFFVPTKKENSFLSCDYSQIELRVLASMAGVTKLIEAFNNNEDIHEQTAKLIFGYDDITPTDRRRAKAVNFGIIYGISAFGLANDIGISNREAQEFIKKYFEVYPEIKEYMDKTIEFASTNGFVLTIKNRKRYIPDINSKVFMQKEFAKRTAMNAPIQGSAADIIKIAMVNVARALKENRLRSKMLLTIHDELIFEVAQGEEDALLKVVRTEMEGALKLSVPLTISANFGSNLYEVK